MSGDTALKGGQAGKTQCEEPEVSRGALESPVVMINV